MPLSRSDFEHAGLEAVHFGGSHPSIPTTFEGRCQRLTDSLEAATKPQDLDLPGNGFVQSGNRYSVDVDGRHRISFEWDHGHAHAIDFT